MHNPAHLIRTAGRLMLARAYAASPGPWEVECWNHMYWITAGDNPISMDCSTSGVACDPDNDQGGRADAEHMAAFSPGVAIALGRWLLDEADTADAMQDSWPMWANSTRGHGALTVATEYLKVTKQVLPPALEIAGPLTQPWSWN